MTQNEMIYAATYAIEKKLSYEELRYSDEMYGKEDYTDEVWEYVIEAKNIGAIAFKEKYSNIRMYYSF